jgi:hypothetical protein
MGALTLSNTPIDLCDASGRWIGIRIHCVPQMSDGEHSALAARRSTMSDVRNPTREEIDAKLETVVARTEARFIELTVEIARHAESITHLNSSVTTIRSEVKEDYKFTRWTIGVTIVASLIAFAAALWVTQGNMLAAFQSGRAIRSEINAPSAPT